jgi:hypothetical protein
MPDPNFFHPGSTSTKNCFQALGIWAGLFIPGPDPYFFNLYWIHNTAVPEFIDAVFAKTASINSGTVLLIISSWNIIPDFILSAQDQ